MALQENRIRDGITIIGGGTTGYLATLYIAKNYPDTQVEWIYPEVNNPIGVGEATVPDVTHFLEDLGVDTKKILRDINGSLKLGVKFTDFNKGESFCHPFGLNESESAELKKCMENHTVPSDVLEYTEIAAHFDVRQLMEYLDTIIPDIPNVTIKRKFVNTFDEVDNKTILDCTGFNKSLMKQIVPNNFVDISDKIPNNRALVYRSDYQDKSKQQVPYTHAVAKDYGWVWETPLKNTIAFGYVHDGKYDVKDEFIAHLKTHFDTVEEDLIREVPMITGRNKKHIVEYNGKTIIALGLSSFFIEPIESTGLYLTAYGIKMINEYFRGRIDAKEFDRVYNYEFDIILDFIVAHYKFSNRSNEYWSLYKDVEVELYRENNIFPKRSWDFILTGFGVSSFTPKINTQGFMRVRNGVPFHKWIADESNFK
jgi:tryptophan halogenase